MCINFNGYHSGGSSFLVVKWLLVKIKKIRSPSIWFRTPKPVRIRQSGRTGIGGVTVLLYIFILYFSYAILSYDFHILCF